MFVGFLFEKITSQTFFTQILFPQYPTFKVSESGPQAYGISLQADVCNP
jgi:hypothetical protein